MQYFAVYFPESEPSTHCVWNNTYDYWFSLTLLILTWYHGYNYQLFQEDNSVGLVKLIKIYNIILALNWLDFNCKIYKITYKMVR